MASTFSPNLALELIGTGDQAGTWGNTTNTNLGTLIEQAVSGYVTQAVSTGTDTTITIPNGATGVARNMYIELTGTGGASTNLIVPANKKLYFVFNNASDAVTVKVAGQTGVSVPAGSKFILVSNGTDIVEATSYSTGVGSSLNLTTLTATSANITTLSGTTATYTSANITTLSGTSVSYTSGSFTSANITTLTGTNFSATSLTLTNPLGRAQGGTGLSTTPTNGQLLIGNGTGYSLATLTAGSGITITNGTGTISLAAGGLPAVSIQNTTTISAVAGNHYILTAASLTTLTLPASPTISDTIYVTVANGLVTNVVANNGKPIQGISESLVLNAQYASVQLRFTDNTEGWVLA
jgi:hypothetical protein